MTSLKLTVGCKNYDRVSALFDGTAKIPGVEATFEGAQVVTEIFERMIRHRAFDVAELGLTYFLRTMDTPAPPFVALPIFPNRCFRHSAIYINKASGIRSPQDLAGKTIGEFALYGHDAGVWPKGILADDYGVTPDQCRWVIGALDWPLPPIDFVPHPHPAHVSVTWTDAADLGSMLESGAIDALISANVPKCILEGSPKVGRLFEDAPTTERQYFQRTGIFPIMHAIVVRRELLADHPGLAQAIYQGFCAAKEAARQRMVKGLVFNNMDTMVPWLSHLLEANRSLLGEDWWPYGLAANRKAVDTFLRYHHAQGLSQRRLRCEDIFATELLDT